MYFFPHLEIRINKALNGDSTMDYQKRSMTETQRIFILFYKFIYKMLLHLNIKLIYISDSVQVNITINTEQTQKYHSKAILL